MSAILTEKPALILPLVKFIASVSPFCAMAVAAPVTVVPVESTVHNKTRVALLLDTTLPIVSGNMIT